MTPTPKYEYAKLDLQASNIRLVEILPLTANNEIRCRIHVKPLEQEVQYVALSYAWGRPPTECIVYLDGQLVAIRKNLWRFLHTKASKLVIGELYWIDAICVNQQDDAERTHQVNLMSQIYTNASRVDVWLGPAHSDSNMAMQTIYRGTAHQRRRGRTSKFWEQPAGRAIRLLCDRPYWTRLWIFQELMLAKKLTFICGAIEIPGDIFRKYLLDVSASNSSYKGKPKSSPSDGTEERIWTESSNLPRETEPDNAGSQRELGIGHKDILESAALKITVQLGETQNQSSLMNLMEATCHLRCSDPRDKVYALLGIVKIAHERIKPDYKTSISKLLNDVLRYVHHLQQPASIKEVEQQCRRLSEMLGQNVDDMFQLESGFEHTGMPPHETIEEFPLGLEGSNVTLWWTEFNGHEAVEELILGKAFDSDELICEAASRGSTLVVRRLLKAGIRSRLALTLASSNGHTEVVRLFLENGVDDDADLGYYALDIAARHGHKEVIQLLLGKGVDIEAFRGYPGRSVLCVASESGQSEVVQLLLDSGANVNAVNEQGDTALQIASREGHTETVQLLLNNGADINAAHSRYGNALYTACDKGQTGVVQLLLDKGADFNATDSKYGYALYSASDRGQSDIVQLLLRHCANVKENSKYHRRALGIAASQGHTEIVQLLLDNSDINPTSWLFSRIVEAASKGGHEDVVQLLLAKFPDAGAGIS